MKQKTKEVYYCDFCSRHMLNKGTMIKHEKMCFQNPENRRDCHTCEFLEKKSVVISESNYGMDGQETERTVEVFHCSKLSKFLYTPQNEIKQNFFDLGDEFNEPMPKECEHHSLLDYLI